MPSYTRSAAAVARLLSPLLFSRLSVAPFYLLAELIAQAAIPSLGIQVLADGCTVENDEVDAFLPESHGRAHREAGPAHLPGGKNVSDLSLPQSFQ